MSEISPLVSNASFWYWVDGWSLILVIIGVIGEGVHEWPPSKLKEWRHFSILGRMSWLILLLGLAGEFVAQNIRNADNNLIIAALNDRAAQAEQVAAKTLVDLNLERQKRESRHVTDVQLQTLVDALSKIGGRFFIVGVDEDEPTQYFDRFMMALSKANLLDEKSPYVLGGGEKWTGIKLYAPNVVDEKNPLTDPFPKAFETAHIPISGICFGKTTCTTSSVGVALVANVAGAPSNGVVRDPALIRPMRTIYIGQKPLPD
jgi:hypothetical protein